MTYTCNIDLGKAIDWQRGSAENLNKLIELKQAWYKQNHCDFWSDWVVDVFDLRTANEFGLSVWAVILDLPIFDESERSEPDYPAIHFGSFRKNFNHGNFGKNASAVDSLSVEQKRIMLQLKAFILNMRSTTPEINKFLANLFGDRVLYVIDNLDMTYTYFVSNPELSVFIGILQSYDLLPRPAGVKVSYIPYTQDWYEQSGVINCGATISNCTRVIPC